MSSTNSKSWSITNAHGDTTLMFYKRSDDPEYISVFMIAPSAIKTLHVGAARERIVPDVGDAIADCDAGQAGAASECIGTDVGDAVRDCHAG